MRYYVYLHVTGDEGRIFYVGKGSGNRSSDKNGRSTYWKRVVKKHGFVDFVIARFEHEEEALDFENALIEKLGYFSEGGLLVNSPLYNQYYIQSKDPNWRPNFLSGMAKRANNKQWIERNKTLFSNPEFKQSHVTGCQKRSQKTEWKEKQKEGAKKRSSSSTWKENNRLGVEKRMSDPLVRERMKLGSIRRSAERDYRKKISKPVLLVHPENTHQLHFYSVSSCAKYVGLSDRTLRHYIETGKPLKNGSHSSYFVMSPIDKQSKTV